jgi:hypothetical protein
MTKKRKLLEKFSLAHRTFNLMNWSLWLKRLDSPYHGSMVAITSLAILTSPKLLTFRIERERLYRTKYVNFLA